MPSKNTLTGNDRRQERRVIIDGAVPGSDGGMWPLFPVMPVVRDKEPDCGVVAWRYLPPGVEDRSVRVYLCNVAEVGASIPSGERRTWADVLEGVPTIEYATLDEFFDDGWRCD